MGKENGLRDVNHPANGRISPLLWPRTIPPVIHSTGAVMPATNTLDFSNAQAAAKALKKVSQIMIRAGQPVVSSEFNEKSRRAAGITYREATLTVASGQMVVLRVNQTGDIFQVKLNGAHLPIKNQTDSAQAIGEIAAMLEKNQVSFQKAQARKQIALPKGMSTPTPKQALVYAERITQLDSQIAERKATVVELQQQLGTMADALPAVAAPLRPEPMSWLGFKIVNQSFVDDAGPIEVPSRFQIGADVFLGLGQAGDKIDIAAKVIGANFRASKVHYTLAVPTQSVGEQQVYAVLYDVDSINVASPQEVMLDSDGQFAPLVSFEPHKTPSLEREDQGLAWAYVAAREIVMGDPVMLDSLATAGAVAQLRAALEVVETNAPINEAEGNLDQAGLERSLAKSFITAITMLDSIDAPITDAGLDELINIATVSAADVSDIKDQPALAQLLKSGLVETAEGLYMLTDAGKSALEDAGYDAYGEPFGAQD